MELYNLNVKSLTKVNICAVKANHEGNGVIVTLPPIDYTSPDTHSKSTLGLKSANSDAVLLLLPKHCCISSTQDANSKKQS